jgi:hypothetical protein
MQNPSLSHSTSPQHASKPQHHQPAPQSPSPRHSTYALRKLSKEREKNKSLLLQLNQSPLPNATYLNHIRELQNELQRETARRIEAERKTGHSFIDALDYEDGDCSNNSCDADQYEQLHSSESALTQLIQRAHHLLGTTCHQTNPKLLTYDKSTITVLMDEFQSLLEGFYIEQRQNEGAKDVLWLFEELEWRFEEIRRGYEDERLTWESHANTANNDLQPSENVNMVAWRTCLKELVEVVTTQGTHSSSVPTKEVSNLQRQLSSLNIIHNQKVLNLHQEMEAMKKAHRDITADMSKTIENLESKLSEQDTTISQQQMKLQLQNQHWTEERQTFQMNKESMGARIRYLEEIVRSLNGIKSPSSRGLYMQQLSKLSLDEMGDDTDVDNSHQQLNEHSHQQLNECASTNNHDNDIANNSEGLILNLRQQIQEMGMSLQESEELRAIALEEFQVERDEHARQIQELSDYVREILGGDCTVCNGNDQS